jgi:long-chain acyl-CoA synthetase
MPVSSRIHARHLAELYRLAAERFESLPAFATRGRNRVWEPVSFRELYERGRAVAAGLTALGVAPRESVGVFSDNRVEWMIADYGIQLSASVNTPRGVDVTDEDLIHIVNHSGMKTAFVENHKMAERVRSLGDRIPELKTVIQLDASKHPPDGVLRLAEVEEQGKALLETDAAVVDTRTKSIEPEDLFTLIYTSGTTGKPKGVMLTHANMMSQVDHVPIQLNCTDRVLSILPIWHIFERMFEVYAISHGACNYYTSARTLGDDLKQVEPTFMGSAPRLWESLHYRILGGVRTAHPVRRALFHIARFLGTHYREAMFHLHDNDLRLETVPAVLIWLRKIRYALQWLILLPWYGFFNAAVLESVRLKAGGSIKGTISGGGALPPAIDKFFNAIGIPVLEGYGLTETTPVLAVRTPEKLVRGTVGPVIPQTELRIADFDSGEILYPGPDHPHGGRGLRGEIQVRGPQIMKGYFKDPEATAAVLSDDGWFRTGDIGMVTFNDCLKILGRRKATLVLSNGENVEPEPIEMKLKLSRFIDQCVAVGQDEKFVGALILPDRDAFREEGIEAETLEDLNRMPEVRRILQDEIRSAMSSASDFRRFEVVKDFRLLEQPFEVGVEVTNLFKLKRHVIHERYADKIADMYKGEKA